ncbi:MAG: tRNA (adenosine(37)-N6)-dimethylallyltransferase MiaA [Prolixibacteraceae bacterium]|nr:tRNA (adenosine(37)-N6)-dimethylallyltransferase MiaA [Prolixibacteraceae bacterium]
MQKTLLVVTGPTGIGKTALAIPLALHFETEIISCDSRQIFREIRIGTAVPTARELATVKHHLVQSHSIHENYNASRFEKEALEIISGLFKKKEVVLMVGGSMLYIEAICRGIDTMPDADPEVRENLKKQLEKEGLESLRLQLKTLDPAYYKFVDLKNPARIIHALEICITAGKPYSAFRTEKAKERPFEILKIGLDMERSALHNRINSRVEKMVEAGLEQEARSVYPLRQLNALNTVGYREWFACFDGEISRNETIELIKRNSRRYARKQLTWFRKDTEMNWFKPRQSIEIINFIENKLKEK